MNLSRNREMAIELYLFLKLFFLLIALKSPTFLHELRKNVHKNLGIDLVVSCTAIFRLTGQRLDEFVDMRE
jgi:hypothetical protein